MHEIRKVFPHNRKLWSTTFLCCYPTVQGGSNILSLDEILKCDHSNQSYRAVLSLSAICSAVKVVSTISVFVLDKIPIGVTIQMKAIDQYFPVALT